MTAIQGLVAMSVLMPILTTMTFLLGCLMGYNRGRTDADAADAAQAEIDRNAHPSSMDFTVDTSARKTADNTADDKIFNDIWRNS